MVCPNCNSEVLATDRFCKVCGTQVNIQMNNVSSDDNAQSISEKPRKKHKWIWITGCVVIAIIALALYFGSPDRDIDGVKEATLSQYDYGIPIGEALDNWFDGTEEWYTMEDSGQSYVCVRGECKYMTDAFEPTQVFLFRLTDDGEYFYFEGAYDENGNPIFSNTGNVADSWAMDIYNDYFGVNLYDYGIKAAFGDEDTLKILADEDN